MDTLFSYRYMRLIVAALGVSLILTLAALSAGALNILSLNNSTQATITVTGEAKRSVLPDVGVFQFTVEAQAEDVAAAQRISGEKINDIMSFLKGEGGVQENDIKTTGYNAYPRYEYVRTDCAPNFGCESKRQLVGYVVTQNVQVKVRDMKKAGELLAGVGSRGATNLSGLSFELEDPEALQEEVRLEAIASAKAKAKRLAKELGVRLGKIERFSEGANGVPVVPMGRSAAAEIALAEEMVVPDISVGEDSVTAQVTIVYRIK